MNNLPTLSRIQNNNKLPALKKLPALGKLPEVNIPSPEIKVAVNTNGVAMSMPATSKSYTVGASLLGAFILAEASNKSKNSFLKGLFGLAAISSVGYGIYKANE